MVMGVQGQTIAEVAQTLGISTRQVRRYIKEGKLEAVLTPGRHGAEWRITYITPSLTKARSERRSPDITLKMAMDMVKELQERNLQLAGQLGAAQERIRALEARVKLLTAPKVPWWKRLFRRRWKSL